MKIAWFSPLPPQHSGQASYSALLLPHLAAGCEIDLWVDHDKVDPDLRNRYRVIEYQPNPGMAETLAGYDAVLFHMGNHAGYHRNIYESLLLTGGIVVLHDFVLHHFLLSYYRDLLGDPEVYLRRMEEEYGPAGLLLGRDLLRRGLSGGGRIDLLKFPLNKSVLDRAKAVVVHSAFAERLVRQTHPRIPVIRIPLPTEIMPLADPKPIRMKHGMDPEKIVIASFGLITAQKRIDFLLGAVERLDRKDLLCLLVGELETPVSSSRYPRLAGRIKTTGYVDAIAYSEYLQIADICVDMRWPTMGETSASVCAGLAAGKACVVSDIGSFSEFPDDCVVKIDAAANQEETLAEIVERLLNDQRLRKAIGCRARDYVAEHHAPEKAAAVYLQVIESANGQTAGCWSRDSFVEAVGHQMADLGISVGDEQSGSWVAEIAREILWLDRGQMTSSQRSTTGDPTVSNQKWSS